MLKHLVISGLVATSITVASNSEISEKALAQYKKLGSNSQVLEAVDIAEPVKHKMLTYKYSYGAFPNSNNEANLKRPEAYNGTFVKSVGIQSNKTIKIHFRNEKQVMKQLRGTSMVMKAHKDDYGNTDWRCTSDSPMIMNPAPKDVIPKHIC